MRLDGQNRRQFLEDLVSALEALLGGLKQVFLCEDAARMLELGRSDASRVLAERVAGRNVLGDLHDRVDRGLAVLLHPALVELTMRHVREPADDVPLDHAHEEHRMDLTADGRKDLGLGGIAVAVAVVELLDAARRRFERLQPHALETIHETRKGLAPETLLVLEGLEELFRLLVERGDERETQSCERSHAQDLRDAALEALDGTSRCDRGHRTDRIPRLRRTIADTLADIPARGALVRIPLGLAEIILDGAQETKDLLGVALVELTAAHQVVARCLELVDAHLKRTLFRGAVHRDVFELSLEPEAVPDFHVFGRTLGALAQLVGVQHRLSDAAILLRGGDDHELGVGERVGLEAHLLALEPQRDVTDETGIKERGCQHEKNLRFFRGL